VTPAVGAFRGSPAEWDAFAAADPASTLCHRHGWREVIEGAFGHECLWLEARDGAGALRGILPLVRVRSLVFGHYLVSLPFLNYGGPLGTDDAVRALGRHAADLARRDGVKLLELRARVARPLDLAVSHPKLTVVLDLPADSEALLRAFPAKLRSQVRRPFREGMEVRFGPDQVGPFHAVFARHMRDLGTPAMPRAFFERAAAAFGGDAWFGCAWLDGRPVACGAGFAWNGEFEMTWASALAESNRISANMGLYWAFMERAAALGLGRFNFGRCTPGSGTHRFKRQWGGRDEPLWWYRLAPGGGSAATPSPDSAAWRWGPRLWRRLPLAVANALGPRIVRSIP
jgi:serine/alanine adding enzyme